MNGARILVVDDEPQMHRFLRPALEAALEGMAPAEAAQVVQPAHLAGLAPIGDVRATADYRQEAALVLLRRLLARLAAPLRVAA